MTHDFVQELVFRYDAFDYGWFMTLWELLVFVVAALLQLVRDDRFEEIRSIRWREYVNLTVVLAVTQGSGSVALSYVNFPIKVGSLWPALRSPRRRLQCAPCKRIFNLDPCFMCLQVVMKSCKLIPTMALGLLILRRSYSGMEYCAALMLCVGVSAFTLVDSKVSPKFDMTGIALLCLAVAGDAFTVNLQEKILRHLHCVS